MNILLWIVQIILALLFMFSGGTKFLPAETLQKMSSPNAVQLPMLFLRFLGVCEILGALGLLLPSLFRIRPQLTPLAAACLVILMIGAVVITILGDGIVLAVVPFIAGLLCAFVAYGRWYLRPIKARS
jgi:uncharacterized membrane protein YphA (DoxX/SURF4 family)